MTVRNTGRAAANEVFSPEELAVYLGCGRTYAYALLAAKELPSFKIGRLRKVRRIDVDDYIERRMRDAE